MTNLALSALAAALHAIVPSVSEDRVKAVADDVVFVVDQEIDNGGLKSKIKRLDAIAALSAAITMESGLKESVENCKAAGDGGRSVGLGQVMRGPNWEGHSRQEICSSRKLQLKLALHVFDRCWARTPKADAAFRCYTSGDAGVDSDAAKREYSLYSRLRKSIDLTTTSGGSHASMPTSASRTKRHERKREGT